MSDPYVVTLVLKLKPERAEDIFAGFPSLVDETRKFKGFRDLRMHRHAEDPYKAIMIEEWASREDYEVYRAFRATNEASNAIRGELVAPPQADFWSIKVV